MAARSGILPDSKDIPRPGLDDETRESRKKRLVKECQSVLGHRYALVMLDLFSRFICSRPLRSLMARRSADWRGYVG